MSEPGGTSVASAFGFCFEAASVAWNSALLPANGESGPRPPSTFGSQS